MFKYFNILVLFILLSCEMSKDKKSFDFISSREHFADVDLFTFTGLEKIEKPLSYPYIEVRKINDSSVTVVYNGSEKDSSSVNYKRTKDYWESSYRSDADTCLMTTYEYIEGRTLIDLIYCQGDSGRPALLTDIILFQDSTETYYDFGRGINIKPEKNVMNSLKYKWLSVYRKIFHKQDTVLIIHEKRTGRNEELLYENASCYKAGDHSYFWWRHFGWTVKKIDCRSVEK